MHFLLIAIGIVAVSGVPGLFFGRSSAAGQRLSVLLMMLGSGIGTVGVALALLAADTPEIRLPWSIPGAEFHVGMDGLSALFLLPIFPVSLLGCVYGLSYWKQEEHPDNGRKLRLFYGLLTAGMALLVVARNAFVFLGGWEVMALAAFFLVATEDEESTVREAAWLYLAAAHVATLCLFALFALLRSATHSLTLTAAPEITPGMATAIFLLALAGFGLKAGLMPLHVWLPSAHANAPSHVSALLSGVLLKMGIYGLVRVYSLLPNPPVWWGYLLLALGVVSGVLGVAFAIGQHDIKRLLAYHSIENIGIIVMGLGLAMVGRSLERADWIVLGLGGALLHVWNHALFKSLLFLSAGSVVHATHTRKIDHLGGLGKAMPWTSLCFLIGAIAICGLPPLNGFVSELLIYLGLFQTLPIDKGVSGTAAAFAVPALALIGTLAAACFVKVYGAVFLGSGRSEHANHARESDSTMTAPMAVLAACCLFIGLAPALVAPMLEQATLAWTSGIDLDADTLLQLPRLNALAPLGWISVAGLLLLLFVAVGGWALWRHVRENQAEPTETWDCGYALPSPRMQYTSSSFAQMLVGLFSWALRPKMQEPQIRGIFPSPARFHSEVPDVVLNGAVLPATRFLTWLASGFRVVQQGSVQVYLAYIIFILVVLLLWP